MNNEQLLAHILDEQKREAAHVEKLNEEVGEIQVQVAALATELRTNKWWLRGLVFSIVVSIILQCIH